MKFKYTLEEANAKLKTITLTDFPQPERLQYMLSTGLGGTTLYRYLNGDVPGIVAANHLLEYIEKHIAKKAVNA